MVITERLDIALMKCGVRVGAVRDAMGASRNRWFNLRHGRTPWQEREVQALEELFGRFGLSRDDLLEPTVEILPDGRQRRRKGTVTRKAAIAGIEPEERATA